jgi:hypothetical protein
MRWRTSVLVIVLVGILPPAFFSVLNWRAGDLRLWRMRANMRKLENGRPETFIERKVDRAVAFALGEGASSWKNISDSEKKLLSIGRLSERDFVLFACSDQTAYDRLWKDLAKAAPGAHFSPLGKPGPSFYVFTSLHAIAAVEDLPKLEKVIANFNSIGRSNEAQPAASSDGHDAAFL